MITNTDEQLLRDIFNVSEKTFAATAVRVFNFQYERNETYRAFCDHLRRTPKTVRIIEDIPFLPIQFFKSREVVSGTFEADRIFESSGTTGTVNSKHFVKDIGIYEESFLTTFRHFYGSETGYCIAGLLPSYLERNNSSLVYMTDRLIRLSAQPNSGFFLDDHARLYSLLQQNELNEKKTLLIGVTYALLEFAENFPMPLQHTIIMETGGMKGRREELSRHRVHEQLQKCFGVKNIHSEYGMTELLSQAYASAKGRFHCPAWMRVMIRRTDDPLEIIPAQKAGKGGVSGAVNIIDLANLHSCSFIATDDAGKIYDDGSFEISGRLDNSDIRGCSLLAL